MPTAVAASVPVIELAVVPIGVAIALPIETVLVPIVVAVVPIGIEALARFVAAVLDSI